MFVPGTTKRPPRAAVGRAQLQETVPNKRQSFRSLESLFELVKPFRVELGGLELCYPPVEERADAISESSVSECKFGKPEDFLETLKPAFAEIESDAASVVRFFNF